MLTREQIEEFKGSETLSYYFDNQKQFDDLCNLALQALDNEWRSINYRRMRKGVGRIGLVALLDMKKSKCISRLTGNPFHHLQRSPDNAY